MVNGAYCLAFKGASQWPGTARMCTALADRTRIDVMGEYQPSSIYSGVCG
jgi:hypothetical protein